MVFTSAMDPLPPEVAQLTLAAWSSVPSSGKLPIRSTAPVHVLSRESSPQPALWASSVPGQAPEPLSEAGRSSRDLPTSPKSLLLLPGQAELFWFKRQTS